MMAEFDVAAEAAVEPANEADEVVLDNAVEMFIDGLEATAEVAEDNVVECCEATVSRENVF